MDKREDQDVLVSCLSAPSGITMLGNVSYCGEDVSKHYSLCTLKLTSFHTGPHTYYLRYSKKRRHAYWSTDMMRT